MSAGAEIAAGVVAGVLVGAATGTLIGAGRVVAEVREDGVPGCRPEASAALLDFAGLLFAIAALAVVAVAVAGWLVDREGPRNGG